LRGSARFNLPRRAQRLGIPTSDLEAFAAGSDTLSGEKRVLLARDLFDGTVSFDVATDRLVSTGAVIPMRAMARPWRGGDAA
jgi:hypothetical protein